jgi:Tfp pilus assembly protein PilO
MTMNPPRHAWKKWTGTALGLLLLMDLGLVALLWQAHREGPQAMRTQRNQLEKQAKLLKADVARGEKIRVSLPQIGKDCDAFYHDQFLNASTGYSAIEADLDAIAKKAGLKTSGLRFSQKPLKDRGVTEIAIEDSVEGEYPAIIQFINGLERSKNFYLLNDLKLDSATTGGIRLKLELRTYFRT